MRIRRPVPRLSLTKSIPHCSSGPSGFGRHAPIHRDISCEDAGAGTGLPRGIRVPSGCGSAQALHGVQGYAAAGRQSTAVPPQFTQASPQIRISIRWRGTLRGIAVDAKCRTGPSLGCAVCHLDILHRLPAWGGPQKFFDRTSLRMEMSSACSATIFFSLVFFSSS